MTYKVKYRAPKFGDNASQGMIQDTGDPYQNLANGVILQAAEDYRGSLKYLRDNPLPPRIESFMSGAEIETLRLPTRRTLKESDWIRCHKKPYRDEAKWIMSYVVLDRLNKIKAVRATKQYRAYAGQERLWVECNQTVDDCELFFNGDWFKMLTKLDGPELMEEIKSDLDCGRSHLPDLWR